VICVIVDYFVEGYTRQDSGPKLQRFDELYYLIYYLIIYQTSTQLNMAVGIADEMEEPVTITNFESRMSPFKHSAKALYGLVDMGR